LKKEFILRNDTNGYGNADLTKWQEVIDKAIQEFNLLGSNSPQLCCEKGDKMV